MKTTDEMLIERAIISAEHYMANAITSIDAEFGKGHAKKHPELVASFMNVCIKDYEITTRNEMQGY